jgi:DNA repair exonuclease SbcCD ATPase subunit
MKSTKHLRSRLDPILTEARLAADAVAREKMALEEAGKDLQASLKARELLQDVAKAVQQSCHERIATVVTKCLRAVGYDYDFAIRFEKARGRTEARLAFVKDGHEVPPLSAAGGGAVDVAALALRLACLVMVNPPRRRLICLDEPMRGLDDDKKALMPGLLETLSKEMNVQFILCTNLPELLCGTVIDLSKEKKQ